MDVIKSCPECERDMEWVMSFEAWYCPHCNVSVGLVEGER
jgi:hypothetical protein